MQDLTHCDFAPRDSASRAETVVFPYDSIPLHDAVALTSGGNLARIRLADQVYALRITRQGKLILTK